MMSFASRRAPWPSPSWTPYEAQRLTVVAQGAVESTPAPSPTPARALQVYTLLGHTGPVESLAWSPDGTVLAFAGYDHTVIVWEILR